MIFQDLTLLLVTITTIIVSLSAAAVFMVFYTSTRHTSATEGDGTSTEEELQTDVNRIGAWIEYEAHKYAGSELGYIKRVGVMTGTMPSLTLEIDAQFEENAEAIGKDLGAQLKLLTGQNWTVKATYTEIDAEGKETAPTTLKA